MSVLPRHPHARRLHLERAALGREDEQRRAQVRRVQEQRERAGGDAGARARRGARSARARDASCAGRAARGARLPAGACGRARRISRGGSEYGASFGRWSASSARAGDGLEAFCCGGGTCSWRIGTSSTPTGQDGDGRVRRGRGAADQEVRQRDDRGGHTDHREHAEYERSPPSPTASAQQRRASVTRRVSGDQDGRAERDDARHPAMLASSTRMQPCERTSRADRSGSCRRGRGSPRGQARRRS